MKTLGEVCEINPRLGRDSGLMDDTLVSFVPMAALDEVSGLIRDKQQRSFFDVKKGYTAFRNGDVLFAKITPCMENGKAAIAKDLINGVGFGSTEFHVLRPKASVLPEWVFYFVRREPFRWEAKRNFTGTAGQQRVPTTFLVNSRIPVPPIAEQRRIVDLLSRAEGIVRLRREAQAKAAEIIPALFLDMFGDPATNPKRWPVANLGDLLAEAPTLGTMAKPSTTPAGWLDLRVANIQSGQLALHDKRWLDLEPDQVQRFALRDGDIVLARAIGSLGHLGKAVIVHPIEPWTFDSHLMRLRVNNDVLIPEYFKAFLESSGGREEFLKHTRRSAVQFNINGKEIRRIALPLPPVTAQVRFLDRSSSVLAIVAQQGDAVEKAEAIFQAALSRGFSGGLPAAAPIEEAAVA